MHWSNSLISSFALYIYTDGDAVYNSLQNFMAWLVSSSSVSALALITLGALFAFLALFQPSKEVPQEDGLPQKKQKSLVFQEITETKVESHFAFFQESFFCKEG